MVLLRLDESEYRGKVIKVSSKYKAVGEAMTDLQDLLFKNSHYFFRDFRQSRPVMLRFSIQVCEIHI